MRSIAFVGAGPTTLYALDALLAHPVRDVRITVFEAQAEAGVGSPYRPAWNDPAMLSNIASAEIPPVGESLLGWLRSRPDRELGAMQLEVETLGDRTFVPRVALGRYFQSQFAALIANARASGMGIDVRTGSRVVDLVNVADGIDLSWSADGATMTARFDHVVLATGHQWPSRQEARPGYFTSPWPATTLAGIRPTAVGIRGSSLTAIDAAIAVAGAHGAFVRADDGTLGYEPASGTDGLRITMMSRKGLLPEADFYFPLPHPPLAICTPDAIRQLIDAGREGLLDRAFDLFRREMIAVDPGYADATGLASGTVEAFGESYFRARLAADPFAAAQANLAEARANHAARVTVPWRDVLLRVHEVVAAITPHLDTMDFRRFNRHLKPIFVDAYGAVPHETVERVLALHRAGKLEVLALGADYRIDTRRPEGGARLMQCETARSFPIFIEATGQRVLGAIQFPFLSLIQQGIVRDAGSGDGARGIEIDDHFSIVAPGVPGDRLFCVSLPFIMGRHPFAQGITGSHEMGQIVGERLATVVSGSGATVDMLPAVA